MVSIFYGAEYLACCQCCYRRDCLQDDHCRGRQRLQRCFHSINGRIKCIIICDKRRIQIKKIYILYMFNCYDYDDNNDIMSFKKASTNSLVMKGIYINVSLQIYISGIISCNIETLHEYIMIYFFSCILTAFFFLLAISSSLIFS